MDLEQSSRPRNQTDQDTEDVIESVNAIIEEAESHPLVLQNAVQNASIIETNLMNTLRERFGDRYDFTSTVYTNNDNLRIVVEMFLTDYRIHIIRSIQFRLYGNICCGEHICSVNTYIQVFEHVLSHRNVRLDDWSNELIDYGFNFVLGNLYRVLLAMNRHRRDLGLSLLY